MTETVDPIYYPDKAIQSATSDRFNFNPTAEVLAKNISGLSVDDSYTIAVNGEWGQENHHSLTWYVSISKRLMRMRLRILSWILIPGCFPEGKMW